MGNAGNQQRPRYVETELIAAQQALIAAILADLMRHGVHEIIAEVFIKAAVPVAQHAPRLLDLDDAVGAQPQISGLYFEFVYGALNLVWRR